MMKYFVYVSDTKVNMLFSQIPKSLKSKIAGEIKIDLKVFSTTFKDRDIPSEETRYSKLQMVLDYIEKHNEVGTIESSNAYFKGELEMRWGEFPNTGIVYFTGITNDTILGLGGSLKHVIGNENIEHLQKKPGSTVAGIQMSLVEELQLGPLIEELQRDIHSDRDPVSIADSKSVIWAVEDANEQIRGSKNRLEFVARRLCESTIAQKIVLGSPLYVAYAD